MRIGDLNLTSVAANFQQVRKKLVDFKTNALNGIKNGFQQAHVSSKNFPKSADKTNSFKDEEVAYLVDIAKEEITKPTQPEFHEVAAQPSVSKRPTIEKSKMESQELLAHVLAENLNGEVVLEHKGQKIPVIIQQFGVHDYNGPSEKGFIDRHELMSEAANRYLSNNNLSKESRAEFLKLKDEYREKLNDSKFQVKPKLMNDPARAKEAQEAYLSANHEAQQHFAEFANAIVSLVKKEDPHFNLKSLQASENDVIASKYPDDKRPTIINIYEINGTKYFSMQEPANREKSVIPTVHRDKPGLVNYVVASSGVIDQNNIPRITLQVIRHASMPPIKQENETMRKAATAENAKEAISDQAQRMYSQEELTSSSPDKPLIVPMHTMMLFTAKQGDFLRNRKKGIVGTWTGESETMQLHESVEAMEQFNGKVFEITLNNGDKAWIKNTWNYMNFGTNPPAAGVGLLGKIPTSELQHKINARGFDEFEGEVLQYMAQKAPDFAKKYENLLTSPQIETARGKITALKKQGEQLSGKQLEENNTKILDAYKNLSALKRAHYLAHEKDFDAFHQYNHTDLVDIQNALKNAQDAFYKKKWEKKDTVMELQVSYIQAQNLMENHVEFYCKSGKDRTGRLNNILEEREIFRHVHDSYPTPDQLPAINQEIAPKVAQFSASGTNAQMNTGSAGLQIGSQVNPVEILPAANKKSSQGLLKNVYKLANKTKR